MQERKSVSSCCGNVIVVLIMQSVLFMLCFIQYYNVKYPYHDNVIQCFNNNNTIIQSVIIITPQCFVCDAHNFFLGSHLGWLIQGEAPHKSKRFPQ